MCRKCTFLYYDRPQCASVSPDGDRCGLWHHHSGDHTALTPSDAPWFAEPPESREAGR